MTSQGASQPSAGSFQTLLNDLADRMDYEPQVAFPIGSGGSTEMVDDPDAVAALRWAVLTARSLCLSERGMQATARALASPPTSPARPKDFPSPPLQQGEAFPRQSRMLRLIRLFFEKHSTVIVAKDTAVWGYIMPSAPKEIFIQRKFILETGRMFANFKDNINDHAARTHVFFLAVVVAHELQHAIRLQFARHGFTAPDTPVKVRSEDNRVRRAGKGLYHGEGGWLWEQWVLGGFLALRKMKPQDAKVAGQSAGLWIYPAGDGKPKTRRYYEVDCVVLRRLTQQSQTQSLNPVLPLLRDSMILAPRQFPSREMRYRFGTEDDHDEDGGHVELHGLTIPDSAQLVENSIKHSLNPSATSTNETHEVEGDWSEESSQDDDDDDEWSDSSPQVYCGYQYQLDIGHDMN